MKRYGVRLATCLFVIILTFKITLLFIDDNNTNQDRKREAQAAVQAQGIGSRSSGYDKGADQAGKTQVVRVTSERQMFHGPAYQAFREDGLINQELLSLAGIKTDQESELHEIIYRYWVELKSDFERRGELVKGVSQDESSRTYFVPADPELAARLREKLRGEIRNKFGEGATKVIFPYLTTVKQFSGLGEFDTRITVSNSESQGEPIVEFKYLVTDPTSGRVLSDGATINPGTYWSRYGDAFIDL